MISFGLVCLFIASVAFVFCIIYLCFIVWLFICWICLLYLFVCGICLLFLCLRNAKSSCQSISAGRVMELCGGSKHEFCRGKISFWFAKLLPVDWSKARKCSLVIGFGETFLARFCRSLTLSWLWLPKYVQTLMSFTFILPELVLKITVKHKAAELEGIFHIWQRLPVLNIPGGVLTWNLF